jgi:hypothetical protein
VLRVESYGVCPLGGTRHRAAGREEGARALTGVRRLFGRILLVIPPSHPECDARRVIRPMQRGQWLPELSRKGTSASKVMDDGMRAVPSLPALTSKMSNTLA